MVAGALGGGAYGMRVAKPGFDVFAEPFGSTNIAFDTRIADIGTVVASGLIQCGAGPVPFPAMNYVPIVKLLRWDGSNLSDFLYLHGFVAHRWLPAIALVTTNSIQVVAFTSPFVNTLATFNPNGTFFLYYVFASG